MILVDLASIVSNSEENWLGSGYSCLVWNKVEIVSIVSLVLDNTSVNTRTFTWVEIVLSSLVEKSVLNVTVDKAVDNLGLVPWGCVFKHVSNNFDLMSLDFSSQ